MADQSPGARIRLRRQALRWTQQDLADRLGVNRATVSAWERNKQLPDRTQGAIEDVLGISLLNGTSPEVYIDPVERAVWEDLTLGTDSERRDLITDLRRAKREHARRSALPPAQ
jgi:transcriptional regulator with XRE-family HTH domain